MRNRAWLRWLAAVMLLCGGAAQIPQALVSKAWAQKADDALRIAWRDAIPNVDPYYNPLRTGLVLAHQAWDMLVYRDPDTFQIKPLLATSWRQPDNTTFEFELRQGVTFHDGSRFTADDVVYTINTVIADAGVAVPSNYSYLAGAEKIDDLHVRVKLKRIFPAALEYMAMTLPIWPKAYRERVGPEGYSRAPVGTGPYRITKIDGLHEIDLVRNDAYFDGPKGHPAIAKLVIQQVADTTAEISAILTGEADWIWQFDPNEFENISRMPNLLALRVESMRIGYISFDAAGRSMAARSMGGRPGMDNPLAKQKVRQAIAHAIDRVAMARQLVQGGSRVPDAACYPTQFGCDQTVAKYDYDPLMAKKLLADAGYPDGFDTELVSYVLPQYSLAVQGYLKVIGINAQLTQLSTAAVVQRAAAGENPMTMGSWGSYSINDVSAILPYFFGGGDNDYTRDADVEKLIATGEATTDPDERRKAYTAALRRIADQMYWLPLHTYVTTYAFSRQLNFKPYPDEVPRFFLTSWK